MHERLAARDADHRRSAFIDSAETLFGRELLLENMRRILNLAASRTGEVAAKERLQHQDQRVAFASLCLLLENVSCYRPHL